MSGLQLHTSSLSRALNIIMGTLSIVCWIVVGWPQMLKNYQDKSGEGLSLPFILIWLAGDLFTIAAALLDKDFVLSILLVGVWYLIMDGVLIFQIMYYGKTSKSVTETTPIRDVRRTKSFSQRASEANLFGSPRSYITSPRTPMDSYNAPAGRRNYLSTQFHQNPNLRKTQLAAVCLSLCAAGTVGWYKIPDFQMLWMNSASLSSANSRVLHQATKAQSLNECQLLTQVFGWISASFYVGSRVPQIVKNYMRSSCEGLSVWMFVFAVLGNFFFVIALLVISIEPDYIAEKAWAITGAVGTLGFDVLIFFQYFWYRPKNGFQKINSEP